MRRETTVRPVVDRRGFASKALLLGAFIGGGTGLRVGQTAGEALLVGVGSGALVALVIYLGLCRLAGWSTAQVSAPDWEGAVTTDAATAGHKQPAADGGHNHDR